MKKRFLSIIICLILILLSIPSFAESVEYYDDIVFPSWYYDGVSYCLDNNYMVGTSETLFSPNANMTRESFAVVLAKLANADLTKYTGESIHFSDVIPNKWYTKSVEWAYDNSLAAGIGNGKFGVGNTITRAEIVTMLYKYAMVNSFDVSGRYDLSVYKDAPNEKSWCHDPLSWAVFEKMITGTSKDMLSYTKTTTRAEVALIIYKYMAYVDEQSSPSAEYDDTFDSFDPVTRIVVASDLHLTANNVSALENIFKYSEEYSASHKYYNNIDAYVMAGDNIDEATDELANLYNSTIESSNKSNTPVFSILGNHEYHGSASAAIETKINAYGFFDETFNGVHVIGVSPDEHGEESFTERYSQIESSLSQANEDDSESPILFFCHYPQDKGSAMYSVLSSYSQVISFYGHNHSTVHQLANIVQDDYTHIGLGTLGSYTTFNKSAESFDEDKLQYDASTFLIVEINKDKEVLIKYFDATTGDFWHTPTPYDHPNQTLINYIPTAWDKTTFTYSGSLEKDYPVFQRKAEITIVSNSNGNVDFEYSRAIDADGVMTYSFEIINLLSDEVVYTGRSLGYYHLDKVEPTATKHVEGLKTNQKYQINITATDICGKVSLKPLTLKFNT